MTGATRRLRAAAPADAGWMTEVALAAKACWGYSRDFMERCRAELTIEPRGLQSHEAVVLEVGAQRVGFYRLARLDEERCELTDLFVDPRYQGRGHGRALLGEALRRARAAGRTTLVVESDPHAEAFYVREGGVTVGDRPSGSIPGRRLPLVHFTL